MIGFLRRKTVTPVLDTNPYADGDQVSTLQIIDGLLTPRNEGEIVTITVLDQANQGAALDLFFFQNSVTVASDNAAFTISDADMLFCLGVVNILTTDYDPVGSANKIATVSPNRAIILSKPTQAGGGAVPAGGGRLFMAIVSRGAPTYAVGSLVINITTEARE